jgi:hypothetical protein
MCICKHWTKFWRVPKGFWHSEKIVTINHDCWTLIIAYQIIFWANLVYALDMILFWRYELLQQSSSYLCIGLFGTLFGVQGNCMLSSGFQKTAHNTCWYHAALYLYQPNNIENNYKHFFVFYLLIFSAVIIQACITLLDVYTEKKSGIFHFSARYRVCYFNRSKCPIFVQGSYYRIISQKISLTNKNYLLSAFNTKIHVCKIILQTEPSWNVDVYVSFHDKKCLCRIRNLQ